ncbi:hypothetical protein DRP53_04970 [candidate division WOR-3 bacterium]|uniref:Septum formation initiator family protein n=1 Tax=candidate division WOR-3 bacterium TaxID=2052148 RepID=A0A660SI82_UNCW3|nr:MAG: hypothetical protein DRP53_04970 [candidate division WOR-3 bacterium]
MGIIVARRARRRQRRIILILAILILLLLFGGYVKLIRDYFRIVALRKEIVVLRAENEALRMRIQRYRSDPLLIENYARDRLGMKRANEKVIYILENGK